MGRSVFAVTGFIAAVAIALAACGTDTKSDDPRPRIVTSTNVWGSVADAVAGDHARVTALYTSGDSDPHEYQPSAADTARVADADIVLLNGGHYDQYMETAPKQSGAAVINAFDHLRDHTRGERAGEANEHVFYNLAVVRAVAHELAGDLANRDPSHRDAYRSNADAFAGKIDGLSARLQQIAGRHRGAPVAQTEPLAGYLLADAGLVDAAPSGFTAAVEQGQSPSAADRAAFEDLLTGHRVRALLYNTQAVDTVTEAVLAIANKQHVPVVELTETLPDGVNDYVAWQSKQIDAVAAAVGA